jgi:hypothetical protein
MKKHLKALAFATSAFLALSLAAGLSHAADTTCLGPLKSTSGPQQSLTLATDGFTPRQIKRSYSKALAAGRAEAIAEWSHQVNKACPGRSPNWFRATARPLRRATRRWAVDLRSASVRSRVRRCGAGEGKCC